MPRLDEAAVGCFWAQVAKGSEGQCWLWESYTRNGYGTMFWKGHSYYVHRVAYELVHGSIDETLGIDHKCMVKLCCNPLHLELVTQSENIRRYHRSRKLLPGYDPAKCKHGHDREPGRACSTCSVAAVARSQAKKPEKYREMKRRNKAAERARKKELE